MSIIFIYWDLKLNILINVQNYTVQGEKYLAWRKNRKHPAGRHRKRKV